MNYAFAIRVLQESSLNNLTAWIVGIILASILSYFMYKKWQRSFEVICINTNNDKDHNFKICHQVIKTYQNTIVENNFNEKLVHAKLQIPNIPLKVFSSFYCLNNFIYLNAVPTFNFSILLFLPSGVEAIKNKIENASL